MRRRTLISSLAVFAVVIVMTVSAQATELQWSGGVTLTESSDQSGIFSRIEVCRSGQVIGCWFSTSGVLPQVFSGPKVMAYGDFPGISRIETVVLSPDHGKTRWVACLVPGKGYQVSIPALPAGGYGLEWGVESKDKHNRLTLIIIPINWSSHRRSSAANHFMVQSAPLGWQDMSDQQLFAFLRGFVPSWATPDPSVLAQMAMMQQSATTPVAAPVAPKQLTAPLPPPAKPVALEEVSLRLLKGDLFVDVPRVTLPQGVSEDTVLVFKRDDKVVMIARVIEISGRSVKAEVVDQSDELQAGDSIEKGGDA